jgi:hypothetical protein
LYVDAVDSKSLVRSFEKVFCALDDIVIDCPMAPLAILAMLCGCIKGEAIESKILTKLPESLMNSGLQVGDPTIKSMLSEVAADLRKFKQLVQPVLDQFFVALEVSDVQTFLTELDMTMFHHEFAKKAITLSYAQANPEHARDSVIQLFNHLTSVNVLSKDDLQWAATRLLAVLDDLHHDVPACEELTKDMFVAMVADELISVPFLRWCVALRIGGPTGLRVLATIQRKTPEYSKRHLSTTQFKTELKNMILEYFNSHNEVEFERCVSELAPLSAEQSAELVRKVMVFAMERSGEECELALKLIVFLCRDEEVDMDAVEEGFDQMYSFMPDVMLDVPDARDMAKSFVVEAKKAGVLRHEWVEPQL